MKNYSPSIKKKAKRKTPEEEIQRCIIKFLRGLRRVGVKLQFVHPANELLRTSTLRKIYWGLGVEAGVPDLIILLPGAKTIFIELKIKKESKKDKADGTQIGYVNLKDEQLNWQNTLIKFGFPHYVVSVEGADMNSRIKVVNTVSQILRDNGLKI